MTARQSGEERSFWRPPYWLGAVSVVVLLLSATWSLVFLDLRNSYRSAEREARMDMAQLSIIMQENLQRSIEAIDFQLRLLRDVYARDPASFAVGIATGDYLLRDLTVQISIVGSDGMLRYSSLRPTGGRVDLSDREHIRVHLGSTEDVLFISEPVVGRVSGLTTIQFTRKIVDSHGDLLGVIVISLDTRQLVRFRNELNLGDTRLLIVGLDGVVRAAAPNTILVGRNLEGTRLLGDVKTFRSGTYRGLAGSDPAESFVSFRLVEGHDLAVVAAVSEASVFESYWQNARQQIAAGLAVSLLSLIYGLGLARYRYLRQKSNLALEESEARLRGLLSASPDALVVVDRSGHIVMASDRVATVFGYAPGEIIAQSVVLLVPNRYHKVHGEHMRTYLSDPVVRPMGTGREVKGRRKDGSEFPAEISLSSYTCAMGQFVIAAVRDVTEQREFQQNLRRWSDAFEKAAFGISITEARTLRLIEVNPAYAAMHGMTPDEMRNLPVMDVIAPEDYPAMRAAHVVADQSGHVEYELTRIRKDGSRFPAQLAITTVYDAANNPLYRIATLLDISLRRRAQEAMRLINARFDAAFNITGYGMTWTSLDGHFIKVNTTFCEMTGYSQDELLARNMADITHPGDLDEALEWRRKILAGEVRGYGFEKRYIRKDGSEIWVHIDVGLVRDAQDEPLHYVTHVQDVTSRRHTEERLRQAQKLEAVGQLAAGIAHDFNNILGAMVSNLDLISEEATTDPEAVVRHAQEAVGAGLSGSELVRRLLAFARRQPLRIQPTNVAASIEDLVPLLRSTVGQRVEVVTALEEKLWPAMADSAQLESALLNLAINARDAMPEGGVLRIETSNIVIEPGLFDGADGLRSGDYVMIAVSDNGSGMTAEAAAHAFEPFFTTKGVGEGSGLGLSQVLGSMQQLGGTAQLYSELGQGTTVRLYLPRSMSAEQPAASTEPPLIPAKEGARILLVEDNALIRSSVAVMLTRLGYAVVEAEDADAALGLWDDGEKFDLVYSDIILPGRYNGVELVREFRRRDPRMKALLTSGFANPAQFQAEIKELGLEVLAKPYRKAELADRLNAVLKENTV